MDCIFCGIVDRSLPTELIYEGEQIVAFRDITPQAPTHVLIVPREHVESVADLNETHTAVLGEMFLAANAIARQEGIGESGYRLVFNCGRAAGQSVDHLHLHLLGGRKLGWPPG
ncbi:MAG: histidine triad nucleotide-binding protein [Chloroflexi bacterium]|nr:histidine triad nucleotide-binding protein [Chloroflexota bacterium]